MECREAGGRYELRSNLIRCSDLGNCTFIEADAKMGKVKMFAENVYSKAGFPIRPF